MKVELADECSYIREASFARRFREALDSDDRYYVPWVWEGSTDDVLVMEYVEGVSVGSEEVRGLNQEARNKAGINQLPACGCD